MTGMEPNAQKASNLAALTAEKCHTCTLSQSRLLHLT